MIEIRPGFWVHIDPLPKEITEREWRDSELLRTDRFAAVNDYSDATGLATYRQELKDYPQQPDFPDGARPTE